MCMCMGGGRGRRKGKVKVNDYFNYFFLFLLNDFFGIIIMISFFFVTSASLGIGALFGLGAPKNNVYVKTT